MDEENANTVMTDFSLFEIASDTASVSSAASSSSTFDANGVSWN